MKVELLSTWLGHKAGSEVVVNYPTGMRLIEQKVAKAVYVEPPAGYITCPSCGAFVKLAGIKNEPKPKSKLVESKPSADDILAEIKDPPVDSPAESASDVLDKMMEGTG